MTIPEVPKPDIGYHGIDDGILDNKPLDFQPDMGPRLVISENPLRPNLYGEFLRDSDFGRKPRTLRHDTLDNRGK